MKPRCEYCNKVLPLYTYRAGGKRPHPADTLGKITTADREPPQFGPHGNNAFCSVQCGFWWAIVKLHHRGS